MKALYFFGPLCLNMAKEDVGYKLSGNAAKDAAIRLWWFLFISLVFLRVECFLEYVVLRYSIFGRAHSRP